MNEEPLKPAMLVIFGITGDLSQRKLLPALYHLLKDGLLHENTQIIGITRRNTTAKELLDTAELCIIESDKVCDPVTIKRMQQKLSMYKMNLEDGDEYDKLYAHLNDLEEKSGMCMERLYYLSIPPGVYAPIVAHLGSHGLNKSCQHAVAGTRILIEKPFGYDVASAKELITETAQYFTEPQIFRIDHYLAKETVQNILTFRFHNPVFESIWDRQHVQRIDIVASEEIGIEGRANFYEQVGALRDLIQSHLLQLLAVATMEQPHTMHSKEIHAAKLTLLQDIQPIPQDRIAIHAIRGQYEGYAEEAGNKKSNTETYAAVLLHIQNKRWQDVPVTIRTGKALREKKTTVSFTFKHASGKTEHTNVLTFSVQPHEGISISLYVKRPGFDNQLQRVPMDFSYERSFDEQGHPDAYERVLVDAIRGDRTLFATNDEVMASWKILQPVITAWENSREGMQIYPKYSDGPALPKSFLT